MKRGLIIFFAGAVIMAASCTEKQDNVIPTPGKDVNFSANLDGNKTRTVYDPNGDFNGDAIKVNWVEGDKIKVYGTTCSQGRQLAEYSVNTAGATNQNYATSLDKTGDAGVQWGNEATSDFYAVYPSSNNGKDFTIASNTDGSVTISASIRRDQKNIFSFNDKENKWVSSPYGTDDNVLSMPDAIMYACTKDVKNGEKVDLNFKPFSTVLKFEIGGYTTNLTDPTLHISEVTITAPEGVMISGDFNITIDDDGATTVVPTSNASNQINLYPTQKGGAYAPVKAGQAMEFSVFVIPQDGMSIDENWTLKIYTNGGNFVKKLKPTAENPNTNLIAGQIHKLNISGTRINDKAPEFDPTEWITQIPRNVYLSELSVPGAWYCTNGEYQLTTTLKDQYNIGVRAFNIDCRLTNQTRDKYPGKKNTRLVCAGSDGVTGISENLGTYTPGDLVLDKLKILSELIGMHPKEYIIVNLTFAEQPLYRKYGNGYLGDNIIYGTVNPQDMMNAIADMLSSQEGQNLNVYRNPIKPETTVNDVLGKMIITINANTDKFTSYASLPSTLITFASMTSNSDFLETDIVLGTFNKMVDKPMYWGKENTGLTYYFHQAQRTYSNTNGEPTLDQRKSAINEIVNKSDVIYSQKSNSGWYQLGIGGYVKNTDRADADRKAVAASLNPYVLDLVEKKLNSSDNMAPSPVGIVLMNYCTATTSEYGNGAALVKAILQMNGKFYLNRDPNGKEWPTGSTDTPVQSAKEGYSSGFNVDTGNWKAF